MNILKNLFDILVIVIVAAFGYSVYEAYRKQKIQQSNNAAAVEAFTVDPQEAMRDEIMEEWRLSEHDINSVDQLLESL